jgi:hypothetical protein
LRLETENTLNPQSKKEHMSDNTIPSERRRRRRLCRAYASSVSWGNRNRLNPQSKKEPFSLPFTVGLLPLPLPT